MSLGLVLDSTASLSPQQLRTLTSDLHGRVRIVDLLVRVDTTERPDSQWPAGYICEAMLKGQHVTTSMAPVESFVSAYADLVALGATKIIAVTLSGQLSGTHAAAKAAAETASVPVEVVDSRTASAALAAAAQVVVAGQDRELSVIASEVKDWCTLNTRTFFVPETLEYLHRGGRIGAATALVGKVLSIVPILGLREGTVYPVARVRTTSKAVDRLAALIATSVQEFHEFNPDEKVSVVLLHPEEDASQAGRILRELDAVLRTSSESFDSIGTANLSTVLTAHVGPGTVGAAVFTTPSA